MTQLLTEMVDLPEALYRRLNIAAKQDEMTSENLLTDALAAYLSDPQCAALPILPAPAARNFSPEFKIPADLHDRALALHQQTGQSFSDIAIRALYLHFDMLDAEPRGMNNTSVVLTTAQFDALSAHAAAQQVTADEAIRRALANLVFNPPAIKRPPDLPADTPLYAGGIKYGQELSDQMQGIINHSVRSQTPLDSTLLIREAVDQYLAALHDAPAPASQPAEPPPAPRPVVTPATRARSRTLRL